MLHPSQFPQQKPHRVLLSLAAAAPNRPCPGPIGATSLTGELAERLDEFQGQWGLQIFHAKETLEETDVRGACIVWDVKSTCGATCGETERRRAEEGRGGAGHAGSDAFRRG